MMIYLSEMLTYPFMTRALVVGSLVSLCMAILGVSLVLKRYSMIGDGLSHVGFGALAVAEVCGFMPLAFAIPVVTACAVLLLRLNNTGKIKGDAAIALISISALAIGVTVMSLGHGANTDLLNYMFGSVLAIKSDDVIASVLLCITVLAVFLCFYNKIFLVTFDDNFARATGMKTNRYNTAIAVLTAISVVLGMRLMGALLVSALIIFPPLTAMRLFGSFKSVTVCAAVLSVLCFILGITLSYIFGFPAGASIVLVNLVCFILFCTIGRFRRN